MSRQRSPLSWQERAKRRGRRTLRKARRLRDLSRIGSDETARRADERGARRLTFVDAIREGAPAMLMRLPVKFWKAKKVAK